MSGSNAGRRRCQPIRGLSPGYEGGNAPLKPAEAALWIFKGHSHCADAEGEIEIDLETQLLVEEGSPSRFRRL